MNNSGWASTGVKVPWSLTHLSVNNLPSPCKIQVPHKLSHIYFDIMSVCHVWIVSVRVAKFLLKISQTYVCTNYSYSQVIVVNRRSSSVSWRTDSEDGTFHFHHTPDASVQLWASWRFSTCFFRRNQRTHAWTQTISTCCYQQKRLKAVT